jgi:hypothetical protein
VDAAGHRYHRLLRAVTGRVGYQAEPVGPARLGGAW